MSQISSLLQSYYCFLARITCFFGFVIVWLQIDQPSQSTKYIYVYILIMQYWGNSPRTLECHVISHTHTQPPLSSVFLKSYTWLDISKSKVKEDLHSHTLPLWPWNISNWRPTRVHIVSLPTCWCRCSKVGCGCSDGRGTKGGGVPHTRCAPTHSLRGRSLVPTRATFAEWSGRVWYIVSTPSTISARCLRPPSTTGGFPWVDK